MRKPLSEKGTEDVQFFQNCFSLCVFIWSLLKELRKNKKNNEEKKSIALNDPNN